MIAKILAYAKGHKIMTALVIGAAVLYFARKKGETVALEPMPASSGEKPLLSSTAAPTTRAVVRTGTTIRAMG